jgi:hypothetical protein
MGMMKNRHGQVFVKNNNPRRALLRIQSFQAVLKIWTPRMIDVGEKLSALPPQSEDLNDIWGFALALDALRHNEPAVRALQEVVDELTERPKREEPFQMVDRLLAFKVEIRTAVKNQRQQLHRERTPGKIGFVRGN